MNRSELHRLFTLIKALRDTEAVIGKEIIDAIDKNTDAYRKTSEPKPSDRLERVHVEVDFSKEQINRYYTDQKNAYRLQRRTFWATFGTLIAVVAYSIVTLLQWRTMDATYREIARQTDSARVAALAATSAANAATDQVKLMRAQLETQGAYLQVRIETNSSPRMLPSDFTYPIGLTVTMQNIGATAASAVHLVLSVRVELVNKDSAKARTVKQIDFTLPSIESFGPIMGMPTPQHQATRNDFAFVLNKTDRDLIIGGKASLRSQGTVTYTTAFDRRIEEPVCYVFWEHWLISKDARNASVAGGGSSTCSDFDNSVSRLIPEIIQNHIRQQSQSKEQFN